MIVSAAYLTRTRICRARNCPDEAETYALFCHRHEQAKRRGHTIELHHTPPPGEPTLWCSTCRTDKPDDQFALRDTSGKAAGGPSSNRRGRFHACLLCQDTARQHERDRRARNRRA